MTEHKSKVQPITLKQMIGIPFRLLWRLIRLSALVIGVLLVVAGGYLAYRSGQPMVIPEARGMTYQSFIQDRAQALKAVPDQNDSCYLARFWTLPGGITSTILPATLAVLSPGSKIDRWLQTTNHYYAFALPRGEARWDHFLPLTWEAVERYSWIWLVFDPQHSYNCRSVRMVVFPDTAAP